MQALTREQFRDRSQDLWSLFYGVNAGMSGKQELIEKITANWSEDSGDEVPQHSPSSGSQVMGFLKAMGVKS